MATTNLIAEKGAFQLQKGFPHRLNYDLRGYGVAAFNKGKTLIAQKGSFQLNGGFNYQLPIQLGGNLKAKIRRSNVSFVKGQFQLNTQFNYQLPIQLAYLNVRFAKGGVAAPMGNYSLTGLPMIKHRKVMGIPGAETILHKEAESYDDHFGNFADGDHLGFNDETFWAKYTLNLGTNKRIIRLRVSKAGGGAGGLEIRLDSLANPPIVNVPIYPTNDWDSYKIIEQELTSLVSGTHDVFIYFPPGSGLSNGNIDWFEFISQANTFSLSGSPAIFTKGYKLVAQGTTYILSTVSVKFHRNPKFGQGAYTLTGLSVSSTNTTKVTASSTSYVLTGTPAKKHRLIKADMPIYNEFMFVSEDGSNYFVMEDGITPFTAEGPGYKLSGLSAIINKGHVLVAQKGIYTLNGIAAQLVRKEIIPFNTGTFIMNGGDVQFHERRKFDQGSFSFNGSSALVIKAIPAASTSYSLVGIAAKIHYKFNLQATTYSLTVTTALFNRSINSSPTSYTLTGISAGLTKLSKLLALLGTYALLGKPIKIHRKFKAGITSFSLTLPGSINRKAKFDKAIFHLGTPNISLITKKKFAIGAYTITGLPTKKKVSRIGVKGSFTISGISATFRHGKVLKGNIRAFNLNGINVAIKETIGILRIAITSFTLSGLITKFKRSKKAGSIAYILVGTPIGISRSRRLKAEMGIFSLGSKTMIPYTSNKKGIFILTGLPVIFRRVYPFDKGIFNITGLSVVIKVGHKHTGNHLVLKEPNNRKLILKANKGSVFVSEDGTQIFTTEDGQTFGIPSEAQTGKLVLKTPNKNKLKLKYKDPLAP